MPDPNIDPALQTGNPLPAGAAPPANTTTHKNFNTDDLHPALHTKLATTELQAAIKKAERNLRPRIQTKPLTAPISQTAGQTVFNVNGKEGEGGDGRKVRERRAVGSGKKGREGEERAGKRRKLVEIDGNGAQLGGNGKGKKKRLVNVPVPEKGGEGVFKVGGEVRKVDENYDDDDEEEASGSGEEDSDMDYDDGGSEYAEDEGMEVSAPVVAENTQTVQPVLDTHVPTPTVNTQTQTQDVEMGGTSPPPPPSTSSEPLTYESLKGTIHSAHSPTSTNKLQRKSAPSQTTAPTSPS